MLFQGRKSIRQLTRNLLAILSLPLVYLRILPDFWNTLERYLEVDHASTFFIIPKKGEPGTTSSGTRLARRAVRYDLLQLRTSLSEIVTHGGEIGVHGIDAWRDTAEARKEWSESQCSLQPGRLEYRMQCPFSD